MRNMSSRSAFCFSCHRKDYELEKERAENRKEEERR
jgi:hypothetical protein